MSEARHISPFSNHPLSDYGGCHIAQPRIVALRGYVPFSEHGCRYDWGYVPHPKTSERFRWLPKIPPNGSAKDVIYLFTNAMEVADVHVVLTG